MVALISVLAPIIVNRTSELSGELLRVLLTGSDSLLDVGVEWEMGSERATLPGVARSPFFGGFRVPAGRYPRSPIHGCHGPLPLP